ncbi:MAG: membrane dipeptidase [Chloroflexi bacterium]|nr:MAG: membrane dipeptidase [Chloroflexota bacterium]
MQKGEYLSLHRRCIVFDAHNDLLHAVLSKQRQMVQRQEMGHSDIPRLLEGGVTAQVFALFIPTDELPSGPLRYTLHLMDAFYEALDKAAERLLLARTAADIRRAKEEGKLAAILSMEGAEGIEEDLTVLKMLYRLGLRMLGITWSRRNKAADGVSDEGPDEGLTDFGRELVAELNRLGIIIDVSHLAPKGVADVLEASQHPVVASHSNAYALCPHYRNLTDEQIRAIADKGGVIGVTFVPRFLTTGPADASLEHVLDHIDHIIRVAGVDHVGIGSDFEGFSDPSPKGLEDVTCFPNITKGLLERGYSEDVVEKILGGNFLRVFEEVVG